MDRFYRPRFGRVRYRGQGGLVGGIVLAGIGILLLLQNLNIPFFDDLERLWPLILVAVGILQAVRSIGIGGKVWGAAIFFAGAILLLDNLGMIHGDVWRFLWPGILIMIGIAMLARSLDRQRHGIPPESVRDTARGLGEDIRSRVRDNLRGQFGTPYNRPGSAPGSGSANPAGAAPGSPTGSTTGSNPFNFLSEWAIFSGVRRRFDTQDFQGGEAFAMFGGVEIDLRKAGAAAGKELVIEANAICGGIELRVPEAWNVTVTGMGIFGGYEDKTYGFKSPDTHVADPTHPHLIITGFAVFGGVQIQN
jgi:predicted membrane protein